MTQSKIRMVVRLSVAALSNLWSCRESGVLGGNGAFADCVDGDSNFGWNFCGTQAYDIDWDGATYSGGVVLSAFLSFFSHGL
jgi:hypothetical protein